MAELGKSSDEVASSSRQVKLRSLIMDDGEKSSKCGYCMSSTQTSIYHGLWAYRLTVDDYQDLLDRGWRLSGMYLYQPNMRSTSCPQYAIRLKASCFIPSKEQRRVLNRMHRYLDGSHKQSQTTTQVFGINDKEFVKKEFKPSSLLSESRLPSEYICSVTGEKCYSHPDVASIDEDIKERIALAIKIALVGLKEEGHLPQNFSFLEVFVKQVSTHIKAQLKLSSCRAVYTSNVAFSIAAGVCNMNDSFGPRKTRLQKKQNLDCKQEDEHRCFSAVLAELLASKIQSLQILQGLTIKACKGHLNFFSKDCQLDDGSCMIASLCQKKNNEVMPASGCLKETRVTLPSTKAVLDISLKRSEYDPEEFSLYKRYQVTVHNDKPEQVTESSYKELLVDTPLIPVPPAEDGSTPFCGFGSFHQQYRIDGQLVAVAVVDVLPRCLSSKYLFWDPDFSFLSLGKYTALYEINWVQELCTTCISLEYYYLGYYIHFCPKMRYKAA